jgi:hypothetical protein
MSPHGDSRPGPTANEFEQLPTIQETRQYHQQKITAHIPIINKTKRRRRRTSHRKSRNPKPKPKPTATTQSTLPGSNQTNEPYGDLLLKKLREHFRVAFQNVNGIRAKNKFADLSEICCAIKRMDIDSFGAAETCLDWNRPKIVRHCRSIIKKFFKNKNTFIQSASKKRYDSIYQPGGTATILNGNWNGNVIDSGQDSSGDGRWSHYTMQGKSQSKVTFITGYRVCQQGSRKGQKTAFAQQWSRQRTRMQEKTQPNPRQAFLDDLSEFIKLKQKKTATALC